MKKITILFAAIAAFFSTLAGGNKLATADSFNGLDSLQKHAFDSWTGNNFDPNNFDPDAFDMNSNSLDPSNAMQAAMRKAPVNPAELGQGGQFTITVVNAQAGAVTVELFNFIKSITTANNPNVTALNPFTALDVAAANANSLVFFDRSGNLVYRNAAPADCTISCKQIPYVALFKASSIFPLQIDRIRMTVTNDAQIENDIIHTVNSFLGLTKRNPISPRSFFSPNQFQSKTIDLVVNCRIDAEKGLETIVNAGETVTYNVYLRAYTKL